MDIIANPQLRIVTFKLSGRSTGGTDKIGHLIKAINLYRQHYSSKNYVSIQIQLEDGSLNVASARQIVKGYLQAADMLMTTVRKFGGTLDIDLGFVRL